MIYPEFQYSVKLRYVLLDTAMVAFFGILPKDTAIMVFWNTTTARHSDGGFIGILPPYITMVTSWNTGSIHNNGSFVGILPPYIIVVAFFF